MKLVAEVRSWGVDVTNYSHHIWRRMTDSVATKSIVGDTVLANNFSRSQLDEMATSGEYHKFLFLRKYESDCVYYVIGEPTTLLTYLTMNTETLIKKVLKHFELTAELNKPRLDYAEKGVQLDHPNVKYLRDILSRCPRVMVEADELPKPKEVKQHAAKIIREALKNSNMCEDNIRYTLIRFTKIYRLLELDKLNKKLAEEYSFPVTREQYNALALMQSYATPFSSCQYLPLHELEFDTIEKYLSGKYSSELVDLTDNVYTNFCLKQNVDFLDGSCDRFFKLSKNNTVEKRFSIYYDSDGDYIFGNFYNSPHRTSLKIGGLRIDNTVDPCELDPCTETYFNNDSAVDYELREFMRYLAKI